MHPAVVRAWAGGLRRREVPGSAGRHWSGRRHPAARPHLFFGLCEQSAEAQRIFEECQGDIERLLPLLYPEWELPATLARTDVIVTAHAKGIEAKRMLPFARDRDHDRGPHDLVRLAAEQLPVWVEHYMQMRPGIDVMPSAAILGHCLLHPLWLWLFRHHSRLRSPDGHVRHVVRADAPSPNTHGHTASRGITGGSCPCNRIISGRGRRHTIRWRL